MQSIAATLKLGTFYTMSFSCQTFQVLKLIKTTSSKVTYEKISELSYFDWVDLYSTLAQIHLDHLDMKRLWNFRFRSIPIFFSIVISRGLSLSSKAFEAFLVFREKTFSSKHFDPTLQSKAKCRIEILRRLKRMN